jgi:cell fate regulator YaaT (PSP1 superfamily)
MLISPVSSQKLLNDTSVVVPVSALRKALEVKTERDYLQKQLTVCRDTIKSQNKIIKSQDSTIKISNVQITLYKKNETRHDSVVNSYKGVIKEKENQVSDLQTKLNKSYILTGLVAAVGIFLIILL